MFYNDMGGSTTYTIPTLIAKLKRDVVYELTALPVTRCDQNIKNILNSMGIPLHCGAVYVLNREGAARLLNILETML